MPNRQQTSWDVPWIYPLLPQLQPNTMLQSFGGGGGKGGSWFGDGAKVLRQP